MAAIGTKPNDPGEIERAIATFAQTPNGGLIIAGSPAAVVHRNLIITLAAQHQLPAVYCLPFLAHSGGLIAYGPDTVSPYRRSAQYVDRISRARSQRTFQCKRRPTTNW